MTNLDAIRELEKKVVAFQKARKNAYNRVWRAKQRMKNDPANGVLFASASQRLEDVMKDYSVYLANQQARFLVKFPNRDYRNGRLKKSHKR